jgi:hypothetical protein
VGAARAIAAGAAIAIPVGRERSSPGSLAVSREEQGARGFATGSRFLSTRGQ